jgi:hypothetical protein
MTALAGLWPDDYTAAVVRKFSPGMLAELAAWIIATAVAGLLAALRSAPVVLVVLALVVVSMLAELVAVVWSAPAGADSMTTGPPGRAREAPYGAGRN